MHNNFRLGMKTKIQSTISLEIQFIIPMFVRFFLFFRYYLGIFIILSIMQQRYRYCNQEIIKK